MTMTMFCLLIWAWVLLRVLVRVYALQGYHGCLQEQGRQAEVMTQVQHHRSFLCSRSRITRIVCIRICIAQRCRCVLLAAVAKRSTKRSARTITRAFQRQYTPPSSLHSLLVTAAAKPHSSFITALSDTGEHIQSIQFTVPHP